MCPQDRSGLCKDRVGSGSVPGDEAFTSPIEKELDFFACAAVSLRGEQRRRAIERREERRRVRVRPVVRGAKLRGVGRPLDDPYERRRGIHCALSGLRFL
jgi:hypothetical protein